VFKYIETALKSKQTIYNSLTRIVNCYVSKSSGKRLIKLVPHFTDYKWTGAKYGTQDNDSFVIDFDDYIFAFQSTHIVYFDYVSGESFLKLSETKAGCYLV
jgi:hypothetical protein